MDEKWPVLCLLCYKGRDFKDAILLWFKLRAIRNWVEYEILTCETEFESRQCGVGKKVAEAGNCAVR